MMALDLTPKEVEYLTDGDRCSVCGHLEALHTEHCCLFCDVPDCPCSFDQIPKGKDLIEPKGITEEYSKTE